MPLVSYSSAFAGYYQQDAAASAYFRCRTFFFCPRHMAVALMWLVPDRRIERTLARKSEVAD